MTVLPDLVEIRCHAIEYLVMSLNTRVSLFSISVESCSVPCSTLCDIQPRSFASFGITARYSHARTQSFYYKKNVPICSVVNMESIRKACKDILASAHASCIKIQPGYSILSAKAICYFTRHTSFSSCMISVGLVRRAYDEL